MQVCNLQPETAIAIAVRDSNCNTPIYLDYTLEVPSRHMCHILRNTLQSFYARGAIGKCHCGYCARVLIEALSCLLESAFNHAPHSDCRDTDIYREIYQGAFSAVDVPSEVYIEHVKVCSRSLVVYDDNTIDLGHINVD